MSWTSRQQVLDGFLYHPPANENVVKAHEHVRIPFLTTALAIHDLLPESREKSLALTKLQEAHQWVHACIANHGDEFLDYGTDIDDVPQVAAHEIIQTLERLMPAADRKFNRGADADTAT